MSTIKTLSKFYFGHTVSSLNRSIDFDEGGDPIEATLKTGTYSPTEYAAEWQRALREAGTQEYLVNFDRLNGKMIISANNPFNLRAGTGPRTGTGAWSMAGFTSTDKTGLNTYTSENRSGSVYEPQYILHDYTAPEDSQLKENATVNETPLGIIQQISYGDGVRIKMNIRVITNKTGLKNENFVENSNGVADARAFMAYLLTKGRCEFMPDKNDPDNFVKCVLISTREDRSGKEWELKNMKVPDFYETGPLVFRKVLI